MSSVLDGVTRDILRELKDDPTHWAVFLDIDGTLLELALTPDAIIVPPSLPDDLDRLRERLQGAMALVTGRALAYADQLFTPHRFPLAGLHGAEIRDCNGNTALASITPEFEALKQAIAREAESMPGVLIEDKGAAVAAHYRLAPDYQQVLAERMQHYVREAGPGWALQLGKMVFEIRPARSSKGDAVEFFMQQAAFANRRPLAFGDDLTDESMFSVVNARGGHAVRVGNLAAPSCAAGRAPSPVFVREAIAAIVAGNH
ncbi:trehalose-phosphatase [Rhizobium sp. RU36D]|uniref:trehalose-phosphatase n=1 Tax=Rhizobium sp. RU36D TaxID=1907415 RepID=UPI001FCE1D8D|nr:trehalose-phosphatase [Rhizobium sp. RU36D]